MKERRMEMKIRMNEFVLVEYGLSNNQKVSFLFKDQMIIIKLSVHG